VPQRFAPREAAMFRAGLELSVMHCGLCLATLLVRARLMPSLVPLARVFRWMAERLKGLGSDRGGMTVEARGLDAAGRPSGAIWSLVAEAGDGPVIPTLPALAAIRALADGRIIEPGARACVGVLDLDDITRQFAHHRITTQVATTKADAA
jgi:hypothetical protein